MTTKKTKKCRCEECKAKEAYYKALEAYLRAGEACVKASEAYEKAPPCPVLWSW